MKSNLYTIASLLCGILMLMAAGCSSDDNSLKLDGNPWITSITFDNYAGVIDNTTSTITVELPKDYDTDSVTVTSLSLSTGAEATVKKGDVLNLSVAQMITVTNGDVYFEYTVSAVEEEAQILSFVLNGTYTGVINQTTQDITVRVPETVDRTQMTPTITVSDGAAVSPASGTVIDFTHPVDFTVSKGTASSLYTVTVVVAEPCEAAYVGLASSLDGLNDEEKEAASWMLTTIDNAEYISFADLVSGNADLSNCKVIWWHLHVDGGIDSKTAFEAAAPNAVSALSVLQEMYEAGTSFLLTRYATFYAAYLGATADENIPNNCWGQVEESGEITSSAWYFFSTGHESHALYQNLIAGSEASAIYTCGSGYRITNSTAQWHIGTNWGGYADYATWRTNHGGTDLGYGSDGAIVVWEYPANGTKGGILCIGSGCYDWYSYGVDTSSDPYHENVATMTENAIEYLLNEE